MGLQGRLRKLEFGPGSALCPECGCAPNDPVELVSAEGGGSWEGYPEPLRCGGCRRVLRFTLKLGDVRPVEVGT